MIWTFCSAFIVVLYPLWESRVAIVQICKGLVKVGVLYERLCDRAAELYSFFFARCHMVCRTSFLLEVESLWCPQNRPGHEMKSEMRVFIINVKVYLCLVRNVFRHNINNRSMRSIGALWLRTPCCPAAVVGMPEPYVECSWVSVRAPHILGSMLSGGHMDVFVMQRLCPSRKEKEGSEALRLL